MERRLPTWAYLSGEVGEVTFLWGTLEETGKSKGIATNGAPGLATNGAKDATNGAPGGILLGNDRTLLGALQTNRRLVFFWGLAARDPRQSV